MIDKVRYCFLWENQYFELDFFNSPSDHLPILELELTTLQSNVYIPPWIGSLKDITNEPQ
jgi:CYTH domain-containing protein